MSFLRDSLESLDQPPSSQPNTRSRSHVDPQRDPRVASARPSENTNREHTDDLSRRERLQRVLSRLNRIHDPAGSSVSTAYGNRTPSPSRQRLYDWAPSQDDPAQEDNELDQILTELRRQQPDTHPDILRVLGQSQLDSTRQRTTENTADLADAAERRERLRERRRRDNELVSRRTLFQRARQESPSATERMLRYVMDRERSGLSEEEERARGSGWLSPGANRSSNEQQRSGTSAREPWPLPPADDLRARTLQERAEAMQRRYATESAPSRHSRISTPPIPPYSVSSSSKFLENALKYLDQLRSCINYEDALSAAIDHGLATKEFFADKHDDFVMDLSEMDTVAVSSWLQPGSRYEGHQHATSSNAGLVQTRQASSFTHSTEQINPHYRNQGATTTGSGFDHPPGSTRVQPFDATRPWLSQHLPPMWSALSPLAIKSSDSSHDHWPVRVNIHHIDTEKMLLQGTMEAYDVPQHSPNLSLLHSTADRPKAGKKNAPITTYLEGHIIDLVTHSFLTPTAADSKRQGPHPTTPANATPYTALPQHISFPSATPQIDASNWRKLPPFNNPSITSDEDLARLLLSKSRMSAIYSDYIFMRWKERCFVHGKDDKCGSTLR